MDCEHGIGERPHPATRTFDVPGRSLVRLCERHAGFWLARAERPAGTVEIVTVDLSCNDIGLVAELVDGAGPDEASFIVPRATYHRWAAARAAWEDAQAEMTTELAKASVDALVLSSELDGRDRRSA